MTCDNCCIAEENTGSSHRCRADESSCVDGKACPDYIEHCDCTLSTCSSEEELEFIAVRA